MVHMAGEASRERDIEFDKALSGQVNRQLWMRANVLRLICGGLSDALSEAPAQGKMNKCDLHTRQQVP